MIKIDFAFFISNACTNMVSMRVDIRVTVCPYKSRKSAEIHLNKKKKKKK
jgi:hypothetical protein